MQSKCTLKFIDNQMDKEYAHTRNKEINYHSFALLVAKMIMLIFTSIADYLQYDRVINT